MSGRRWLVITSSFPRHRRDVAGHFVEKWCRALVERGHEIDVLCWRAEGANDQQVGRGLRVDFVPYAWRGAERLFFGAGAPENLRRKPGRVLLALPAVAAMVRAALHACERRDYDAVVGHWLVPGGAVARIVGATTGLPVRVVGHSAGVHLLNRLPKTLGRPLSRWICGAPVTVTTAVLRDGLVKLSGRGDVRVAPMGYEAAPRQVRSIERSAGEGLRLGFLGRLVPIKGLPTVLQVMQQLRAEGLELKLEVVGDGPCRQTWEAKAGEGVEFLGPRFGVEKWRRLARWDALVMPSTIRKSGRHEGMPVSVLEAASVGTVPLVSGVPGVERWLVRPKQQIVVGGFEAWRTTLRWLAGLDEQQLSRLREETAAKVCELEWGQYSRWWEGWLEGGRG